MFFIFQLYYEPSIVLKLLQNLIFVYYLYLVFML